ncbi:MAG: hypothetical protein GMKNLPBB_00872 [Myxococcota bacterium]|nr:hypothetical protein [Myxococcota bacterium]
MIRTIGMAAAVLAVLISTAAAQDKPAGDSNVEVLKEKQKEGLFTETKKDGWDLNLTLGAGLSLTQNSSFVGQPDGLSTTLSGKADFAATLYAGLHEWRNSIGYSVAFARTPAIDDWVKTNDVLALESIYFLKLEPWVGPFARLYADTPVFQGYDQRAKEVTYLVPQEDGTVQRVEREKRFKLTDIFLPFRLKETVGGFLRPYTSDPIAVEFLIGVGGRQVIVGDATYVVADIKDTPEIELNRITSFAQGGPELIAGVSGVLAEKRVNYGIRAEAMMPVIDSAYEGGKSTPELTNIELNAKVAFKLVSWASLDYEFRLIRQPVLVDATQVQNLVLLTFSYALLEEKAEEKK